MRFGRPRALRRLAAAVLAVALASSAATPASASASRSTCATRHGAFLGTLCVPGGVGLHPAIVLFGGSEGGDSQASLASDFAVAGYVAVSVAYFGESGLPEGLARIPVETTGPALAAILAREDVDPKHVAALGFSRGGELALLAATRYPAISAVVCVVGSPFVWAGYPDGSVSGWTIVGKPLPYVSTDRAEAEGYRRLPDLLNAAMRDREAVARAFIPLERIRGRILFVTAGSDETWNSVTVARYAQEYLAAHHRPEAALLVYLHVGHAFLLAASADPNARVSPQSDATDDVIARYTNAASDAWPKIFRFLREGTL